MKVKAIGFDLDDTLYYRGDFYKEIFEIMQKKLVKIDVTFDTFFEVLLEHSEIEYMKFMNKEKSKNTYKNDRIIATYKEFGVDISNEDAVIFNSLYLYYRDNIKLRENASSLLNYLIENDYDLFVLTNGAKQDQNNKLECLGIEKWIPKDKWFISDELQMTKPDKDIFQHVEKTIGYSGSDICYIGDSYTNDIQGANALGWETVYFSEDTEFSEYSEKVAHFKELHQYF